MAEWNHDSSVEWHLEEVEDHAGIQRCVASLNRVYREQVPLHERDCDASGFEWVAADDSDSSVLCFLRWDAERSRPVLCAFNFTPQPRVGYRFGVDHGGEWLEIYNSDATEFGGSGMGNMGAVSAQDVSEHGRPCSIQITLPPLAAVYFTPR